MMTAEEYECSPATEFAKSAQDFYCTAPPSPEVWSAIGTCAAAIFAAVAVFIAWRVHRNDKRQQRLTEIRVAAASLIGATNDLIFQSDDVDRDNMADRSHVYQKSIVFELSALKPLDPERFNAAINWILKASGLRAAYNLDCNGMGGEDPAHSAFLPRLVHELTLSLRSYDMRKGKFDLVQDLVTRFDRVFSEPQFGGNQGILDSLISQEKDYLHILLDGQEPRTISAYSSNTPHLN